MPEDGSREARCGYGERIRAGHGSMEVKEAAVRPLYGAPAAAEHPDYAALTRGALDALRGVVGDLDRQRGEIRRLRTETREILAALAA